MDTEVPVTIMRKLNCRMRRQYKGGRCVEYLGSHRLLIFADKEKVVGCSTSSS